MIKPTFIRQKYFNTCASHRIQIISNRIIKFTRKYLFLLLFQLTEMIFLMAVFIDLNVECGLLNLCQSKMQAQMLIFSTLFHHIYVIWIHHDDMLAYYSWQFLCKIYHWNFYLQIHNYHQPKYWYGFMCERNERTNTLS